MKVLYVASYDVTDLAGRNGTDYFKMSALQEAGCDIIKHSPIPIRDSTILRLYERAQSLVTGYPRLRSRTKALFKQLDREIQNHKLYKESDVIFCPNPFDVSHYSGKKPLFTWTDMTYKILIDLYPATRSAMPAYMQRVGHEMQAATISRANGGMWSSRLAMQSAIEDYGADPYRQGVIPFGLNLWGEKRQQELKHIISQRDREALNLLFIGHDFTRKGWDSALNTVIELNRRGIPSYLNMVGGHPTVPPAALSFVTVFGPLNKGREEELALLESLLRRAHFLIMPTKADLSPMPPIEAMSYGCPTLITDVGASSEVVVHGETGFVFPVDSPSSLYADVLSDIWLDPARYERLCYNAYKRYKENYRWKDLGKKAKAFMEQMINIVP